METVVEGENYSKNEARPYRSRNRRPCDACRRRRTGCFRENKQDRCLYCRMRDIECTFDSGPLLKRKRASENNSDNNNTTNDTSTSAIDSKSQVRLDVYTEDPRERGPLSEKEDYGSSHMDEKGLDLHNGRTALFVGFSGDQDPWLLQKCPPPEASWDEFKFRNAFTSKEQPVVFSICPTEYLEPRPDLYSIGAVQKIVNPFSESLFKLYFNVVHPSYPILNYQQVFQKRCQRIQATLLSAIFVLAIPYWTLSENLMFEKLPKGDFFVLRDFLSRAVPLETGAATLQTIQTILLTLQVQPIMVRDANHPGHWALTASLVAVGQELGLNLEPSLWDIPISEKRMRRKLWWAIYVQDKWESLGLSRPSHIRDDDFNVVDICYDDFLEGDELTIDDSPNKHGIQLFIALINVTRVLSDILNSFYTVKATIVARRSLNDTLETAHEIFARLESIEQHHFPLEIPDILSAAKASLRLAKNTLILSTCRAVLYSENETLSYPMINQYAHDCCVSLIQYLSSLGINQINGSWWTYSRVNLAIVGSCILAFYVASRLQIDDANESHQGIWYKTVYDYRQLLVTYFKVNPVAKLALLRYDNLLVRVERAVSLPGGSQDKKNQGDTLDDLFREVGDAVRQPEMESSPQSAAVDEALFLSWLSNNYFSHV